VIGSKEPSRFLNDGWVWDVLIIADLFDGVDNVVSKFLCRLICG